LVEGEAEEVTMIRGIKIAPETCKCSCCWEDLTAADRELGSSYATIDLHSVAQAQSQSINLYFCRECASKMVLAVQSRVGTCILNDAVEGAVRTLVRLSEDLRPGS
jgi:hypothetical protein